MLPDEPNDTPNTDTDVDDPVDVADKPREPTPYERKLRAEAKGYRLKAQEEAKKREEEVARIKSESDATVETERKKAHERILRAELKTAALKAGMVDLDGLKLADLSKVKLNDDGEVEGADELMEEMKKAKPYLFGVKSDTSTPNNPPNPKKPEAKSAKDMTPEEYEEAKKNVIKTKR